MREGGTYCVVQLFEPMDSFGIPISNDYDCPLLSLNYFLFRCIPAHCILQSVSQIHECSPTCDLQCVNTSSTVERLFVSSQKHMFVHDFSINLYSFNVYCMHSV